jgi:hypothetical protein
MVREGRDEAPPRSDVSFRLDQKTGDFKVAIHSRVMQWRALTEGKQKNELARTQFRFINTIIMKKEAITRRPSPLYQRCTAAKDGKFQGSQSGQSNAVECID